MLERLLDVAVYAMLAALVAIGVGKVLDQRRDAQTVAWTESVTRAMERLAATSQGYSSDQNGSDMSAALIASTLLPAGMIDRTAGVLRNAFGGAVTVVATPDRYTITQDLLPSGSCVVLVARARDWAQRICVNGGCAAQLADADPAWSSQACNRATGQKNSVTITIVP